MGKFKLNASNNIALKIPEDSFEKTLHFYRDILLMDTEEIKVNDPTVSRSAKVTFGPICLWLDAVPNRKEPEVLFELSTDQLQKAIAYFKANDIELVNPEEEGLENVDWIRDPAGNILHLSSESKD